METSQNHYPEILTCYLEGADLQAVDAEHLGELQAETQNTPAQEHSE